MKGYSKINTMMNNVDSSSQKSRSVDFSSSDLALFPQTPKPIGKAFHVDPKTQSNQLTHNSTSSNKEKEEEEEEEEYDIQNGGVFGNALLRRNCSVSSANYGLQSAVKRVFSMRRSSSVSERYCRIYDQSVTLASPIHDDIIADDQEVGTTRSAYYKSHKQIKGSAKILKACKRFLGL